MAIGGVLLISASTLVNGQRGETEFTQAMRDIDSKFQTIISGVNSGTFTVSSRYECSASGGRPVLIPIAGGSPSHDEGTSSTCLVMGKAIQAPPGKSQLYIYTVLGLRAGSYEASKPTPAIAATGGDLTETYNIASGGAVVKSTGYNGGANRADLAGFYYDPTSSAGSNRVSTQPLLAKAYALFSDPSTPPNPTNVRDYIEEQDTDRYKNFPLDEWRVCFRSPDSSRTAYLDVFAGSQGVNTKLTFNNC